MGGRHLPPLVSCGCWGKRPPAGGRSHLQRRLASPKGSQSGRCGRGKRESWVCGQARSLSKPGLFPTPWLGGSTAIACNCRRVPTQGGGWPTLAKLCSAGASGARRRESNLGTEGPAVLPREFDRGRSECGRRACFPPPEFLAVSKRRFWSLSAKPGLCVPRYALGSMALWSATARVSQRSGGQTRP